MQASPRQRERREEDVRGVTASGSQAFLSRADAIRRREEPPQMYLNPMLY